MMNKYTLSALAITTVSLAVGTAQSARLPGAAGHQWPNPDCVSGWCTPGQPESVACFEHTFAAMENRCSPLFGPVTRLLVVPMPTSNTLTQNHTISARIRSNGQATSTCQGLMMDNNNVWTGSNPGQTSGSSFTTVSMGTLFVPNNSVVHVECQVAGTNTSNPNLRGAVLRVAADPQP